MANTKAIGNGKKRSLGWYLSHDWQLWVMLIPAIVYIFIFCYMPMYGAQLAFRDYDFSKGIYGGAWAGFKYFQQYFSSAMFGTTLKNTFIISLCSIVFGFPAPIILAIVFNQLRHAGIKRALQTIVYIPYFISTVVLVSMIIQFTDISTGFVNQIIVKLGGRSVNFMGTITYFRSLYVWTGVWQTMGYSAIVYLAALTGVPMDLYDAAKVDGASKLRRIISIDIPYIAPTIITLFILNTGSILSIGFEKIYLMQNSINTPISEVISTYVYKLGLVNFNYSFSTAVGLFNSLVNLCMLVMVNAISRQVSQVSVL